MTCLFSAAPDDYVAFNQRLVTLADKDIPACVTVTIKQDDFYETNETFVLVLTSDDPLVILVEPEIEITIMNDDIQPIQGTLT